MNIIEIENQKNLLIENISSCCSIKQKILLVSHFFNHLIEIDDNKIKEAYISEFINDYVNSFVHFDPFSLHPKLLKQIIKQLQVFEKIPFLRNHYENLKIFRNDIQNKLKILEDILAGNEYNLNGSRKVFFPVLEKENYIEGLAFGSLESLTIKIERSKNENCFIVIPRERELEERIEKQVYNSWSTAINFCSKYRKKILPYHKVFIYFDKMQGIYSGNSLGIALTLGFIEELLKIYNAPAVVKINERIAFTGGMDKAGNIQEVSKKIIESKSESIFFSPIEIFVVHKHDEPYAIAKVEELKKEYPKRKIEITGVATLVDLLNRRNLVDIRKQNPFLRVAKAAGENILSIIFAGMLVTVIIISGIWDFDNNPARLYNDKNILYVKNQNEKILWTKEMVFDLNAGTENIIPFSEKIVDINDDGINEVLICNELLYDKEIRNKFGRIICVDKNQKLIWEYQFTDSIYTSDFPHSITYRSNIIDTFINNSEKALLAFARNLPLYPNAVYKLNLRTGERLDSINTFWHAGRITSALLGDFDNNGTEELVAIAINNGYERSVLFSIDINKIYGQSPAPSKYTFKDIPIADFNSYIMLPVTDYCRLFFRYNSPQSSSLSFYKGSKEFQFNLIEGIGNNSITFNYRFSNELSFIRLDCSENAQQRRDTLVSRGILKPPYTNTNEYLNLLKDQMEYWDGKKFVKTEQYFKQLRGLP